MTNKNVNNLKHLIYYMHLVFKQNQIVNTISIKYVNQIYVIFVHISRDLY